MLKICILNCQSGNTRSVYNLFSSLGSTCLSNQRQDILDASHLILPGVGAFGSVMEKIHTHLPLDLIEELVLRQGKPLLGICVGMQVLASIGEEFGQHTGLDWIPGVVKKLPCTTHPLPHIGWNDIQPRMTHPLLFGLPTTPDFYFVHSFAFTPDDQRSIIADVEYETSFPAIVGRDNLLGVQFHPEKSQKSGIQLARNFLLIK